MENLCFLHPGPSRPAVRGPAARLSLDLAQVVMGGPVWLLYLTPLDGPLMGEGLGGDEPGAVLAPRQHHPHPCPPPSKGEGVTSPADSSRASRRPHGPSRA